MFESTLTRLVNQLDGALGAAVLSAEGLVIDAVDGDGQVLSSSEAFAEYAAVFTQIQSVGEAVDIGEFRQLSVRSGDRRVFLHVLSPRYFAALAVGPGVIPGRAQFHLRVAAPDLAREL